MRRAVPCFWLLVTALATRMQCSRVPVVVVTDGEEMVVVGGVVRGTWSINDEHVDIDWFARSDTPPKGEIDSEVARLSGILDRRLKAAVQTA